MGTFDPTYTSAPDGLSWCHCLTVPRLLTRCEHTGRLLQTPVPELDSLRGQSTELTPGTEAVVAGRQADIVLEGIAGDGTLTLDNSFEVFFERGRLGVRYLVEQHAVGRQERSIPLDAIHDLRVLVDGSAVEVFANGGADVFACRWFCDDVPDLVVHSSFTAQAGTVWPMEDVMSHVYATAQAPDLAWPGWNASHKL